MGRVAGKRAIITGAGTGIGRACFELFAAEGAEVFGIGLNEAELEEAVAAVRSAGGTAAASAADLSRPEAAERAFEAAMARLGGADILLNAAGVGYNLRDSKPDSMNDTVGTSPEDWRTVLSINLDSVFHMCRLAIPGMQAQGGGAIVNFGSIFGLLGAPDAHAYTASKGAIINYTRSLCVAYAKDGIRANVLCPGFVDTPMAASIMHWFEDPATAEAASPMGRAASAAEMASCCLFLASDDSSYCNGTVLVADGGHSAR